MALDGEDDIDYYRLLGVPEAARADDIRKAFHHLARAYHPDRFVGASEEEQAQAAYLYRRAAEAYRVLMRPSARAAYDQRLAEAQRRAEAGRFRRSEAPTTRLAVGKPRPTFRAETTRARPLVTQAFSAYRKGDLAEARKHLKLALGIEPQNADLKRQLEEVERRM